MKARRVMMMVEAMTDAPLRTLERAAYWSGAQVMRVNGPNEFLHDIRVLQVQANVIKEEPEKEPDNAEVPTQS